MTRDNRLIVILLAIAIDLVWGDPPNRFHPLILMGHWLGLGRRLAPSHYRFWFGLGWTVIGVIAAVWPFWRIEARRGRKAKGGRRKDETNFKRRGSRRLIYPFHSLSLVPALILRISLHAVLLKPVFAYRNLRRAVIEVKEALAANDLAEARRLAGWHLVSRDVSQLTGAEVAGAAIESLAENLTDSVIAPLLAYLSGGLPAAWAYRFANTADAMWGYRTAEFEQLGKFPARLDDALNWLPARLTGWLLVAAARPAGGHSQNAARTMLTQYHRTPSLNAGWTMSAMAGALEVTLSKRDTYELAGGLNAPDVRDIDRALKITDLCLSLSVFLMIVSSVTYQVSRVVVKKLVYQGGSKLTVSLL
jgi:adenosylcobinamide-phosphate synthase